MELRDLIAMVTLADTGRFHRAANELGIDVSTLSRRVQRLEEDLGVLIFERKRHRATLTSGGQELLRLTRRIVNDLSELRSSAKKAGIAQLGRLRLATQLSLLAPYLRQPLQRFRMMHPEVRLELTEANDKDIISGIDDHLFDAAFLFSATVSSSIEAIELSREPLVLAVAENHPFAKQKLVSRHEIRSEPVLVQGWTNSDAYRLIQASILGTDVDFRVHRAGCAELMGLVALNEGVMITLASHREFCLPGVKLIDIDDANAELGVSVAWSPSLENPVAGSFVAAVREWVRSHPEIGTAAAAQTPCQKP